MFNPLRLPDLIGNNIPPHVRAFWRVVCLRYLSTRDIMKFIWIVLFSVLEIIKAYKTPLFPYCPIVNHHKSRCVRLKSRMLPGGEYGNRTTLKILSRFDKWHCIERSYKKKIPPGTDCEDSITGHLCPAWDGKLQLERDQIERTGDV